MGKLKTVFEKNTGDLFLIFVVPYLGIGLAATFVDLAARILMGTYGCRKAFVQWLWSLFYASPWGFETPYAVNGVGILAILPILFFAFAVTSLVSRYKFSHLIILLFPLAGLYTMKYMFLPCGLQIGLIASPAVYLVSVILKRCGRINDDCYAEDNGKRDKMIDIAKGIAIILMVYGHSGVSAPIFLWIFSFHMPLFFITSGYFAKEAPMKKVLPRKIKGLLVPYLSLNLLLMVFSLFKLMLFYDEYRWSVWRIFISDVLKSTFFGMSYSSTILKNVPSVGVVWFIASLFWAVIIFQVVLNVSKKKTWLRVLLSVLCVVAGWLIGTKCAFLPWSFDVSLVGVGFLEAGFELRKIIPWLWDKKKLMIAVPILLIVWAVGLKFGQLELATRIYRAFPLPIITAVAGSVLVLLFSKLLCRFDFIKDVLSFCGENSLLILSIHNIELKYLQWGTYLSGVKAEVFFIIRFTLIISLVFLWVVLRSLKGRRIGKAV